MDLQERADAVERIRACGQRWIRVHDAAALLQLPVHRVYALAQCGDIAAIKMGRAVHIPVSSLEEWLYGIELLGTDA
jgi:excisionase family DNA binding protein